MARSFGRLEQFWVLQVGGWIVYAGGVLIGLLPHFRYPEVVYDLAILPSMFVASFILRLVCRRSFQRGTAWPKAMILAVLASIVCAVTCSIVAVSAAHRVQSESLSWPMLLVWVWCGIIYAALVLTSWSGLYLGIKHYQLFRSEHARAQEAEELARSAKLQRCASSFNPIFFLTLLMPSPR